MDLKLEIEKKTVFEHIFFLQMVRNRILERRELQIKLYPFTTEVMPVSAKRL